MPIKVRRIYLETIRERYENAPKRKKSEILNEFCVNCSYTRKYAIRILRRRVEPRLNKPGPRPIYGSTVKHHLVHLWKKMNHMCSKNMKVALPIWLEFYKEVDHDTKSLLIKMSASTIDRILRPFKHQRGISTTHASLIKSRIPIKLLDGDITKPGYVEADTVAHCGNSLQGEFANSLTVTDLFSAWTENRAMLTKTADQIVGEMKRVESAMPFMLLGLATDNGSEFINDVLFEYCTKRLKPIEFVRRRAYKKNDNAHVEQKNFTHVREIFGYQRFEHAELVRMMNEIYQAYWNPLHNYFMPTLKLKSKVRVGSRIQKKYESPRTPAQRLLESVDVPHHIKRKIRLELECKNPFYLQQELEKKLKLFFEAVDTLQNPPKLAG